MSMWTAFALIAIAFIVTGFFNDKRKHASGDEIAKELEELRTQLDTLDSDVRTRIETLERIVTSPKEDLKRQFDHLDKTG